MSRLDRIPPTVLVLGAVASVQFGAAVAKSLFDEIGPGGTVFLRVLFAAIILAAAWRPGVAARSRADLLLVVAFGFTLVAMNFTFYEALERIPLGIAVTFEFVGPLGVAIVGSRRALDLVWVVLAAAGIVLLSDFGTADLDTLGVGLALLAGGFWAAYILLAARVGQTYEGGQGLALAMSAGALMLAPVGVADAGTNLLGPGVLLAGFAVAIMSSAIPYTLEMEALRRMPAGVFGVLMSLEPAMAALAGFIVLDEGLAARELVAIVLVVAASAGAARNSRVPPRDA
ncbi:MAG TPA: DMT family transporter [Thermoleophilaceae bacterium]|jgi:inner membrane transporter RhtA|nr:DMT family transporter [Thermoleophilaceae bacterium]